MADEPHFPYDPRNLRRGCMAAAAVAAMAGGAALSQALGDDGAVIDFARAGICVGLLLAFAYAQFRLRRRQGWGVTLGHSDVSVSRPFSKAPLAIPYDEISKVRREGKKKESLLVYVKEGGSLIIARRFFPDEASFEALYSALARRVPTRVLDA